VPKQDAKTVRAGATKELFIDFLTKDLTIEQAVVDLVDNCVDGAKRLRKNGKYDGLKIDLRLNGDTFEIDDNCGGIPVNIAREYAFRFGRPENLPPGPWSVGQFGVGMKRALFKLGGWFSVDSVAEESRFVLEVSVDKWRKDPKEPWEFRFKEVHEKMSTVPESKRRTKILVKSLREDVSSQFLLANFKIRLAKSIRSAHQVSISQGLQIRLDDQPLLAASVELLVSDNIHPGYMRSSLNGAGKVPVQLDMYTGIGNSAPTEAGWYLFCNDRLLLNADQTLVTGWGQSERIPRFHPQYARFRGLVFFRCEDTARLPWNTTKTGVDPEVAIFQQTRLKMVEFMSPVIKFLNRLDRENQLPSAQRILARAVKTANLVPISSVTKEQEFNVDIAPSPPSKTQKISYSVPIQRYERVRSRLNTTDPKEVGERTFDYYYDQECD
jgi:hypothetical protein